MFLMPDNKWARLLAYVTGLVNQKLLLQNEYLAAENRILRAHLPARMRLSDPERSTLAEIGKRLGRAALQQVACVAKPDTILAWYRRLIARKFDGSKHRASSGRPPLASEVEALIVRFAREHSGWGYDRIVGALANRRRRAEAVYPCLIRASRFELRVHLRTALPPRGEIGMYNQWRPRSYEILDPSGGLVLSSYESQAILVVVRQSCRRVPCGAGEARGQRPHAYHPRQNLRGAQHRHWQGPRSPLGSEEDTAGHTRLRHRAVL